MRRPGGRDAVGHCLAARDHASRMGACASVCERPGGLELTDRAVELAQLPVGGRLLDVGCGKGATVAYLRDSHGLRATGLDASPAQIARARDARPDLDFVEGQAERLPFGDASFAAVLAECVLSTLSLREAALGEMRRVLTPGGRLLLTDLYARAGSAEAAPTSPLPSLGPRELVEGLLADAGFCVEAWEDHTGALARLLWDLAGSGQAPAAATERAPSTAAGRRLGYFLCIARAPGEPAATGAKGAHDA